MYVCAQACLCLFVCMCAGACVVWCFEFVSPHKPSESHYLRDITLIQGLLSRFVYFGVECPCNEVSILVAVNRPHYLHASSLPFIDGFI